MTRPLVSVVVAVHNGERFLAEALDSLLAQTYEPVEAIVVDDGSTDGSAAIARGFPVRLIEQENRGVAAARNAGIAASRGSLLAFLDQDDVWQPAKLERQVEDLHAHPEAGWGLVWVEILLQPGAERPRWLGSEYLGRPHFRPLPSGLIIRREAFEQVGPFDESYTVGSDTDWFARAKDAGVAGTVVEEPLLRWRVHDANSTHGQEPMRAEFLRALKSSVARKRASRGVSVIVPAYNAAAYLGEALESALGQTVAPAEVIVVDDGSADETLAVARGFEPRVTVLTQANAGPGAARNRGIERASGEYLALLDADDIWEPAKLERQLAVFDADPGLDLVFTHVREFVSPDLDPAEAARLHPRGELPGRFTGTMVVRTASFGRVGPFPEDVQVTEGLDWFLRAHEAGLREAMVAECLSRRRLHETNNWRMNPNVSELAAVLKASLDRRRASGDA